MTTFSTILRQYLDEERISLREYWEQLNDLSINISYASLYAYYTGKNVPSFEMARKILNSQRENLNEKEIIELLKHSRKLIRQEKEDNKILSVNLKIKPEQVDEKFKNSPKLLKSIIEMRCEELYGDDGEESITQLSNKGKRKMSYYIANLIKEDLKKNNYFN